MHNDGDDGKRRDDRGLAVPKTGRRMPRAIEGQLLTQLWLCPLLGAAGRLMIRGGLHRGGDQHQSALESTGGPYFTVAMANSYELAFRQWAVLAHIGG